MFAFLIVALTLPPLWLALIPIVAPVVAAAAVHEDGENVLRGVVAGFATVAAVVLSELGGEFTFESLFSTAITAVGALVVQQVAYRFGWSRVDINATVLPGRGIG